MTHTKWREQFPKEIKPAYEALLSFLPVAIRPLFLRFNDAMNSTFRVYNKWHRYERVAGWVYGYCRNYRCELLSVSIGDASFRVLGIDVVDQESLCKALEKAKAAYEDGYEDKYARLVAEKRANQIERTKIRTAREKAQIERLKERFDPGKLNRFKWPPKVARAKLIRLYQGEAAGLLDEALLDDVGFSFYTRCQQARETRALMDRGRLICHHCGEILSPGSYTDAVACPCGYAYTYREYRRSCNAANMPGGRADPIFHAFADRWPGCKAANEKMRLIDWLVHECHVTAMSGEKGRSVCVNLIEGTLAQLRDTLEMLAGHV